MKSYDEGKFELEALEEKEPVNYSKMREGIWMIKNSKDSGIRMKFLAKRIDDLPENISRSILEEKRLSLIKDLRTIIIRAFRDFNDSFITDGMENLVYADKIDSFVKSIKYNKIVSSIFRKISK